MRTIDRLCIVALSLTRSLSSRSLFSLSLYHARATARSNGAPNEAPAGGTWSEKIKFNNNIEAGEELSLLLAIIYCIGFSRAEARD